MPEAETVSVPRLRRAETASRLAPLIAPEGPRRLGAYELVASLGEGGMGTVCIARRSGPGGFHRFVAIKRVHAHLAKEREAVAMFLDEARLAATVSHRNVTQIYELGESEGTHFLVMELVDGVTLSTLSSLGPIPLPVALHAVSEAARGLHAAHEARDREGRALNLVHRDVSPSNVLVGFDGSVKVSDFGVAKAEGRLSRTETGLVRGKASFMAPEQALGEDVDRRADVFSLGVLLHELATTERPFGSGASAEVLLRIVQNARPPVKSIAPELPDPLCDVIERCLAPERASRFPTAGAVADALDALRASLAPCSAADVARWMEDSLGADWGARRAQLAALEAALDSGSTASAETGERVAHALATPGPAQAIAPPAPGRKALGVWAPLTALVLGAGVVAAAFLGGGARTEPDAGGSPGATGPPPQPALHEAPSALREAPAALREAPAALREAPAALREAPAALREAPAVLREAPAALRDAGAASLPNGAQTADVGAPREVSPGAANEARGARSERARGTLIARCASPAEVWIDGTLLGETFLSVEVPAGRHRLVLRQNGREDRRTITVRRGAATSVGDCFPAP
jgi:serine/threonine-protein kinase